MSTVLFSLPNKVYVTGGFVYDPSAVLQCLIAFPDLNGVHNVISADMDDGQRK